MSAQFSLGRSFHTVTFPLPTTTSAQLRHRNSLSSSRSFAGQGASLLSALDAVGPLTRGSRHESSLAPRAGFWSWTLGEVVHGRFKTVVFPSWWRVNWWPSADSSTLVEESQDVSSAAMTEIWRMLASSSAYIRGFGSAMVAEDADASGGPCLTAVDMDGKKLPSSGQVEVDVRGLGGKFLRAGVARGLVNLVET